MNTDMKISIRQKVSEDLALRDSANRFFDYLDALPQHEVSVSFAGVKSITRSFAHQYLARKKQSAKGISEVDVPDSISRMFEVVESPGAKFKLPVVRRVRTLSSLGQIQPMSG